MSNNQKQSNKHGGKRSGAGRKAGSKASHTLQAQEIKKEIIARAFKELDPIITALVNKAKKGNIYAIQELFNRALGKPVQDLNLIPEDSDVQGFKVEIVRTNKNGNGGTSKNTGD